MTKSAEDIITIEITPNAGKSVELPPAARRGLFGESQSARVGKLVHAAIEEALRAPIAAPVADIVLRDANNNIVPRTPPRDGADTSVPTSNLDLTKAAKPACKVPEPEGKAAKSFGEIVMTFDGEAYKFDDTLKPIDVPPPKPLDEVPFVNLSGRPWEKERDDTARYRPQTERNAIEEYIPHPYVGPPSGVKGVCELSQFVFEYVSHDWSTDYWNFGLGKRRLQLCAKVRPRGDEPKHDPPKLDERGLMKLYFSGSFDADRPEAVCIRATYE